MFKTMLCGHKLKKIINIVSVVAQSSASSVNYSASIELKLQS